VFLVFSLSLPFPPRARPESDFPLKISNPFFPISRLAVLVAFFPGPGQGLTEWAFPFRCLPVFPFSSSPKCQAASCGPELSAQFFCFAVLPLRVVRVCFILFSFLAQHSPAGHDGLFQLIPPPPSPCGFPARHCRRDSPFCPSAFLNGQDSPYDASTTSAFLFFKHFPSFVFFSPVNLLVFF